jgi:signal transduction histidine kinase
MPGVTSRIRVLVADDHPVYREGIVRAVKERPDDGRGLDRERARAAVSGGHVGLASCAERLEAVGGRLELEDRPGGGTLARAWLPDLSGAGPSADAVTGSGPHRPPSRPERLRRRAW